MCHTTADMVADFREWNALSGGEAGLVSYSQRGVRKGSVDKRREYRAWKGRREVCSLGLRSREYGKKSSIYGTNRVSCSDRKILQLTAKGR